MKDKQYELIDVNKLKEEEEKLLRNISVLKQDLFKIRQNQKEIESKLKQNINVTTHNNLVERFNIYFKQESHKNGLVKSYEKKVKKIREKLLKKQTFKSILPTEKIIPWINVRFLDGAILFELSKNNLSSRFGCKISRRSYNFLKKYFIYKKLPPLKVKFIGDHPMSVQNLDELNSVLEILEIENHIYFDRFTKEGRKIKLSNLGLNKQTICSIYDLYSKSLFFEHLVKLHDDKYKIIPIPETILNEKYEVIKTEDSFVFANKKENVINLVWESVAEKKATYIFKTSTEKYSIDIQILFDYICSPDIKNKRENLINSSQVQKKLNYFRRVVHFDPSGWIICLAYL